MQYAAAKMPAPQVDIEAGAYLVEMLMEVGPVKGAPMGGVIALDWADLQAYASGYPCEITHDERLTLVRMSQAYVSGFHTGADPLSIAPIDRQGLTE